MRQFVVPAQQSRCIHCLYRLSPAGQLEYAPDGSVERPVRRHVQSGWPLALGLVAQLRLQQTTSGACQSIVVVFLNRDRRSPDVVRHCVIVEPRFAPDSA